MMALLRESHEFRNNDKVFVYLRKKPDIIYQGQIYNILKIRFSLEFQIVQSSTTFIYHSVLVFIINYYFVEQPSFTIMMRESLTILNIQKTEEYQKYICRVNSLEKFQWI